MKIVQPSVEFMHPVNGDAIMQHLEACGRVCYKSEDKISAGSAQKFLAGIIARGHEAVLEHVSVTVKFICDRGVSHEIVRHRVASYCQESTRYCNYGNDGDVTFIEPSYLTRGSVAYTDWMDACAVAEDAYLCMLGEGCSTQEARAVLPNSLKTEVVMTANIREWRHFLRLRCSGAAHPQIRELALPLLEMFYEEVPVLFKDIYEEHFMLREAKK